MYQQTGYGPQSIGLQPLDSFPDGSDVKKSACQCGRLGFSPWVGLNSSIAQ